MKQEPIFKPGLHDIKLTDFGNHFLSEFPSSTTRSPLIDGLNKYIKKLTEIGIPIELWIDGSFTTNKIDPNDVDLVVFALENDVNKLDKNREDLFCSLLDRRSTRHRFGCDVLFSVTEDQEMRSYWRGWFGFDRNETPKGIARVLVNI